MLIWMSRWNWGRWDGWADLCTDAPDWILAFGGSGGCPGRARIDGTGSACRPPRIRWPAALLVTLSFLFLFSSPVHGQPLVGDCDGNGRVTVDEVVLGVNLALGKREIGECAALDRDSDGRIGVDELVAAVHASIADTIRVNGVCLQPGPAPIPAPGLAPCDAGILIRAFRCEEEQRDRCLRDPSALTVLNVGSIRASGQFTFRLGRNEIAESALLFEAEISGQLVYRTLAFDPIRADFGAGVGGDASLEIVISPSSEAAVRLVDEIGLENLDNEGAVAVIAAVEDANRGTDFAGTGVEMAVVVAAEVARDDPEVQQTIEARVTPSPRSTPTPTATPKPSETSTPAPRGVWFSHGPEGGSVYG
jgi:hypothetical protein